MPKALTLRSFYSASGPISPSPTHPIPAANGEQPEIASASSPIEQAATPERSLINRLIRLRDGWGWVLGLVALGLAFFGEKLAEDARVADKGLGVPPFLSWVMFGAAAIVFVLGIAPTPSDPARPTPRFFASLRAMSRRVRVLFLSLLGISLVLITMAAPLFIALSGNLNTESQGWLVNSGSWLFFSLALISFGLAWVVWERSVPGTPHEASPAAVSSTLPAPLKMLRTRYSVIIMGALFVLALIFRLPGLDSAPPGLWFDEAQNGLVAQNLFKPGVVHPAFIASLTQMGALYFYVLGIILKIFGTTAIWPLRLLPALGGALIAPMLYAIGTRLYGWRVGLVAGVLVALGAWNITMSRFGMVSLPTVAVDVATYLCLVQALKTGRFGWWAGGGVLLGIALQMYYPSQLVPAVLLLVFVHRLVSGRMAFFRAVRAGLVAFIVGLLIAVTPIATFAVQHTDVYTQRAGTVNIFSAEGSDGRPDALQVSIERHALMFNYAGDNNPRHNLPGAPMLDWVTAALFLAGMGLLVLRVWRWQYFFPLVWFLLTISGGVLSVVFEAPQAHRTLENSVVAPLIAAIFLGELWGALDSRIVTAWSRRLARRKEAVVLVGDGAVSPESAAPAPLASARFALYVPRVGRYVIALAVLLLLAWVGFANVDRYFNKQVNDTSVWMDMGGAEKAVGNLLTGYTPDYRLYVSPIYANVPATLYLAPGKQVEVWPGSYILPLVEERDVVIIFDPTEEGNVSDIVRIYPHAQVTVVHAPASDQPQAFAIHITPDDIKSVRGSRRLDDSHVAASLQVAQYGMYRFDWQTIITGTVRPEVLVDGAPTVLGDFMPLGAGLHSVVISGTQGMKVDFSNLLWSQVSQAMSPVPAANLFDPTKVEPHGLTAFIREGDTFATEPAQIRIDPQVSFYFHITPLERPYTIEWEGKLYAPLQGTYIFSTEQLSRSRLMIDGKEVVINDTPNNVQQGSVDLRPGLHDIRLTFEDLDGFSHMYLYWQPPTMNDKYIIPSLFLLPKMSRYPETPASGAWPTIEQADDTVWAKAAANPEAGTTQSPPQGNSPPESQPTAFPGSVIKPDLLIGGPGTANLPLPRAVAADPDGNIYIYTESNSRITKYAQDGHKVTDWAVAETDGRPVTEGAALLVRDDKVYFLDATGSTLTSYDLDGKEEGRVLICGCYFPRGLAFANDGNLWAADTGLAHVFKVDLRGQTLTTIGEQGSGPGQFVEPASVWESPQGILFVADVGNHRMQTFTSDGKPLAQWPIGEGTSRDNNRITGTPDGDVLVTEYTSRAIVEYDSRGTERHRWTYAPAGVSLVPAGIAPYGEGKYVVLFPFDNSAIVLDITQK